MVVFIFLPIRIISFSSHLVGAKYFEMRRERHEKDSVQVLASTHDRCLTSRLRLWRRGYRESGAWKLVSNKSCHVQWPRYFSDRRSSDVGASEIGILQVTAC